MGARVCLGACMYGDVSAMRLEMNCPAFSLGLKESRKPDAPGKSQVSRRPQRRGLISHFHMPCWWVGGSNLCTLT